jgi:DNA replication protein DnaC
MLPLLKISAHQFNRILDGYQDGYDPAFLTKLRSEPKGREGWKRGAYVSWEELGYSKEQVRAIARNEIKCPRCGFDPAQQTNGPKTEWVLATGKTTGVQFLRDCPCSCVSDRYMASFLAEVPLRYRDVKLSELTPREGQYAPGTHDSQKFTKHSQALVFRLLQAAPTKNYLMLGPPGIGKTMMAFALLRYAFKEKADSMAETNDASPVPSIWRIQAQTLMQEHHEYIMGHNKPVEDQVQPRVSRKTIQAARDAGWRPVLVLEEIDKIGSMTAQRLQVLFHVIDALYENEGQLIITTNKRALEFKAALPEGIYRRITLEDDPDKDRAVVLDFYLYARTGGRPSDAIKAATLANPNHKAAGDPSDCEETTIDGDGMTQESGDEVEENIPTLAEVPKYRPKVSRGPAPAALVNTRGNAVPTNKSNLYSPFPEK